MRRVLSSVFNVLLDNVLPGDIYLKAREMKFNCDVPIMKKTVERLLP